MQTPGMPSTSRSSANSDPLDNLKFKKARAKMAGLKAQFQGNTKTEKNAPSSTAETAKKDIFSQATANVAKSGKKSLFASMLAVGGSIAIVGPAIIVASAIPGGNALLPVIGVAATVSSLFHMGAQFSIMKNASDRTNMYSSIADNLRAERDKMNEDIKNAYEKASAQSQSSTGNQNDPLYKFDEMAMNKDLEKFGLNLDTFNIKHETASKEEINDAIRLVERTFRKMSLKAHPDKGGDPEIFKDLSNARDRIVLNFEKLAENAGNDK